MKSIDASGNPVTEVLTSTARSITVTDASGNPVTVKK